jgi:hypothetical protein
MPITTRSSMRVNAHRGCPFLHMPFGHLRLSFVTDETLLWEPGSPTSGLGGAGGGALKCKQKPPSRVHSSPLDTPRHLGKVGDYVEAHDGKIRATMVTRMKITKIVPGQDIGFVKGHANISRIFRKTLRMGRCID